MSYFPNFIRSQDNLSGNFIDSNKKSLLKIEDDENTHSRKLGFALTSITIDQ